MKQKISDPFYALSDSNRREILMLLSEDSLSINSIADKFQISRPAVSKHLKILNAAGFISVENVGRKRFCVLSPDGFNQLQDWMTYFEQFWENKLHKLETLMNKKTST